MSYGQKPYRRVMMQLYGADVYPSPTEHTEFGGKVLAEHPDSAGSLGIAISEALQDAATHPGSKYSLGSVLNHVLLPPDDHRRGGARAGRSPPTPTPTWSSAVSAGGRASPASPSRSCATRSPARPRRASSASSPRPVPSLTKGVFTYDFGDAAQMTPLLKMYTAGPRLRAGRASTPAACATPPWRRSSATPTTWALMEAVAVPQTKVFDAARLFVQSEAIVPAPESAHAILVAIDEAKRGGRQGRVQDHPLQPDRATASSTWAPTTHTSTAISRTTSTPARRSRRRWSTSRRCRSREA